MEKINILIVDDKIENIIALEALLNRNDVHMISTTLPNEALRISWEQDIAIALVDVQMPEMDGFELVEILKSNPRTKDILIIFVTAISIETKYAVKGLNTGAVDYLYKPLNPYITSAKVDSFIQMVRSQRELIKKNQQLERYQKELIQAKEQAEQGKRIKENFLANMSHELRTPINGIFGLLQLLAKTEINEEQEQMLQLLQVSSSSLLGVINDVLDLSKIESGKFKITRGPGDIRELCKAVINLLGIGAKEKNILLEVELQETLPDRIQVDSLRLNQILMNLIGNAIKFTKQGKVTLKVNELDRKGNHIQLQFSVMDTGIGIAHENIDKIFDVFEQEDDHTTVKYGGTGLGLSIVKNLARLKGGQLRVESEQGKGSAFHFTNWYEVILDKGLGQKPSPSNLHFEPFENVRVLLAEDNPINTFVIIRIFKEWNIQVDVVENGQKALDQLGKQDYDFILMDTYMPVMNGLEAIRLIREGRVPGKERIPIINFSAAVMESDKKIALDAGADDILNKSFERIHLYEKIRSILA